MPNRSVTPDLEADTADTAVPLEMADPPYPEDDNEEDDDFFGDDEEDDEEEDDEEEETWQVAPPDAPVR